MCLKRLSQAVQRHHIPDFEVFREVKSLPCKSSRSALAPFFNKVCQVFRVGGRLANSKYQLYFKLTIIVPRRSVIIAPLVRETNLLCLNGGWHMLIIRQTVWILNGTRIAHYDTLNLQQCPQCSRFNSR